MNHHPNKSATTIRVDDLMHTHAGFLGAVNFVVMTMDGEEMGMGRSGKSTGRGVGFIVGNTGEVRE